MKIEKINLNFILFLITLVFLPTSVFASEPEVEVRDDGYSAQFVSQSISDPIKIEAGDSKEVVFKFKNTGKYSWNSNSANFVSAYAMEPRYRESVFVDSSWISSSQTDKILGVVAPGGIGELKINLHAPDKVGEYIEKFYLASENYSWVKNGYFFIKINVVPKTTVVEDKNLDNTKKESTDSEINYLVNRTILSPKNISGVGGDKQKIIIAFQNLGENNWQKLSLLSVEEGMADSTWQSGGIIDSWEEEVLPGAFFRKSFYIRLPEKRGDYDFTLRLAIDGNEGLDNTLAIIPLVVTDDAPANYKKPNFSIGDDVVNDPKVEKIIETNRLGTEPRIRVGLKMPTYYMQFRSYEDDYNVFVGGTKKGVLSERQKAVIKLKDGVFSFDSKDLNFDSQDYIRLEPKTSPHSVFNILNLDRPVNWVGDYDFNRYRGAVEFRQGEIDREYYAVNDLLLEDYVLGIAEAHNSNNIEFIKANLVAAKNYAYVHKNSYPFFDVLGSTHDQLYLGYEAEQAQPNVVRAAKDVQGIMITYDNKIVTAPYFGNSSGWTKSYSSVWGGSAKAWLVPVRAEYDAGRVQFGHGVGMSQRDARLRADDLGSTFDELLRYYYSGVVVEKVY